MQTQTQSSHESREITVSPGTAMKHASPSLVGLMPMIANGPTSSYLFGPDNAFTMHAARTPDLKAQAVALLQETHSRNGYDSAGSQMTDEFDAVPGTMTFLVTTQNRAVATLRVIPDSPFGLPTDKIFPDKLRPLRNHQRHVCEIASMALHGIGSRESLPVLMELFRLAWWTANHILGATDMVASTMAHHLSFYRKLLLFNETDSVSRTSPRTGCDVCFCRLDLTTAEQRYKARFGHLKKSRNLHEFFVEDARMQELLMWLFSQHNLPDTLSGRVPMHQPRKESSCLISMKPSPVTLAS